MGATCSSGDCGTDEVDIPAVPAGAEALIIGRIGSGNTADVAIGIRVQGGTYHVIANVGGVASNTDTGYAAPIVGAGTINVSTALEHFEGHVQTITGATDANFPLAVAQAEQHIDDPWMGVRTARESERKLITWDATMRVVDPATGDEFTIAPTMGPQGVQGPYREFAWLVVPHGSVLGNNQFPRWNIRNGLPVLSTTGGTFTDSGGTLHRWRGHSEYPSQTQFPPADWDIYQSFTFFDPASQSTAVLNGTSPIKLDSEQGTQGPPGRQGDPGTKGDKGDDGEGVAVGGTAGQLLAKIDATNFNTHWIDAPAGGGTPVSAKLDVTGWVPPNSDDGTVALVTLPANYTDFDFLHLTIPAIPRTRVSTLTINVDEMVEDASFTYFPGAPGPGTNGTAIWTRSTRTIELTGEDDFDRITLFSTSGPAGRDGDAGQGVPVGGTDGQLLSKSGVVDYATAWIDPPSGGGGNPLPDGGNTGDYLRRLADGSLEWVSRRGVTIREAGSSAALTITSAQVSGNQSVELAFNGTGGAADRWGGETIALGQSYVIRRTHQNANSGVWVQLSALASNGTQTLTTSGVQMRHVILKP